MFATLLPHLRQLASRTLAIVRARIVRRTTPTTPVPASGLLADLVRSKRDLLLENALLRQQLLVLRRQTKRPRLTATDRGLLVLLASRLGTWASALIIVQPETVLRWHRQGFRLLWRRDSAAPTRTSRIPAETVALIRQMATENRLWGAERIRGELLKLDLRVGKRTIQKYMRQARPPRQPGQTWATFVRNHAQQIWACDFLQVTDLLFRLTEAHLRRVLRQYAAYFNRGRPHQGLGQRLPCPAQPPVAAGRAGRRVVAVPVLGGLHHEYRRVA